MPPARVLDRGIGLVDPPAVVMDLRQRVFALREEHLPASGEDGERLLGRRQFAPPRLFASGAPFEPLGDFRPGGAGALDQLLAPLDRPPAGWPDVRASGRPLRCVRRWPGGTLRVSRLPRAISARSSASRSAFCPRADPSSSSSPWRAWPNVPGARRHAVAVGVPAFAVASGGVRLPLEGAKTALDLGDDVVEPEQVGGRVLELQAGEPLAVLVAGDPAASSISLRRSWGLAGENHADSPLLDQRSRRGCPDPCPSGCPGCPSAGPPRSFNRYWPSPPRKIRRPIVMRPSSAFSTLPSVRKVRLTSAIPRGLRWPLAVEYDFLHGTAAERLGALLAEHPGDGLRQVALAAAVRSDDRRDAAGERLVTGSTKVLKPLTSRLSSLSMVAWRGTGPFRPLGKITGFMHKSQVVVPAAAPVHNMWRLRRAADTLPRR